MKKAIIALTAAALLGAATLPAPAQAHEWGRYGHHGWQRHHNSGAALALGIFGAFAGAALAASQAHAGYSYSPYGYSYAPYGYAGYGYYR